MPDQLAGPVNKPCHKDENDKESKEAQEALRRASLLQRLPWLPLGLFRVLPSGSVTLCARARITLPVLWPEF